MKIRTLQRTIVLNGPGFGSCVKILDAGVERDIIVQVSGWYYISEGYILSDSVDLVLPVETNVPFPCYECAHKGKNIPRCDDFIRCTQWVEWAQQAGVIPEKDTRAPNISVQPTALDAKGG